MAKILEDYEVQQILDEQNNIVASLNSDKLELENQSKVLDGVKEQIVIKNNELLEVQKQIDSKNLEAQESIKNFETKQKDLIEEISVYETHIEDLESEKLAKQSELDGISSSISETNKQLEELDVKIKEIKAQNNKDIADLNTIREGLLMDNKIISEGNDTLRITATELNSVVDELKSHVEILSLDINAKKVVVDELSRKLDKINNDIAEATIVLSETLAKQKTEVAVLENITADKDAKQKDFEKILLRAKTLIDREDHVSRQEDYLASEFKRIGIEYQKFA
mgnify:CR=1 FL=1